MSPHLANETEPILRRPHDPMNDDTAMGDGTIGLEPSDVQRICHADLTSERSADFSMTIPANLKTLWIFLSAFSADGHLTTRISQCLHQFLGFAKMYRSYPDLDAKNGIRHIGNSPNLSIHALHL